MLTGQAIWALAVLLSLVLERWSPRWLDEFSTFVVVVAAPVTIGGWLFVWGDNGPPYEWIESLSFIITFGLAFYGIVGAIVGHLFFNRAEEAP
jgi:hypothetical protein